MECKFKSNKEPIKNVCKGEAKLDVWLDEPSICRIQADFNQICYCQFSLVATAHAFLFLRGATLDARHRLVASRYVPQFLSHFLPKPVGSKSKTMLSTKKIFLCSSFMCKYHLGIQGSY